MAIFFHTFLEDFGYCLEWLLIWIIFLSKIWKNGSYYVYGLGCNAAGIISARIIDSQGKAVGNSYK
ncbi:MAG: hypothetical protein ACLUUN_01140 [Muribaculaceae bacterium]